VYFVKNTELAPAQVREFIEILPKALNKAAMSTYEKIIEEVKTQADSLLAEERQRTATERQRAEEALQREEEERQRAEEEHQRATAALQREEAALQREEEALQREEEEHQRLNRLIYYLHDVMQLPVSNIAEMMGVEAQYVLELLKQGSTEG
jgi:Skp family chaperone for outer membrane proteins